MSTAAVVTKGVLHTFAGDMCWRYDLRARRTIGEARLISQTFPGVFESGIGAAFADDDGRVCFFRGPDHARFDPSTGAVDRTLFRAGSGWHAGFVGGVDAALFCGPDEVALFKGDRFVRFDPGARRFRIGDPEPISWRWPDIPFDRIDSALRIGDEVVFIRGSEAAIYLGRGSLGVLPVTQLFPGVEPWTGAPLRPSPVEPVVPRLVGASSHPGACGRRRASVESRPRRRPPRRLL